MNPEIVYAQASVHSIGGISMFEAMDGISSMNAASFESDKKTVKQAVTKLKKAGFTVHQVGATSIGISAPRDLYERVFKTNLIAVEKASMGSSAQMEMVTQYDCPDSGIFGLVPTAESEMADVLEGVAIAEQPTYFGNAFAPTKSYWHLRVPGDVSLGLNADMVHRRLSYTGKGIRVAMVDTGWYEHPYFKKRGYNYGPVVLGTGATDPTQDTNGHGTAESANIFAVAPDVRFQMVKQGSDAVSSFNAAVALNPHIITCSWGWDIRTAPLSAYLVTLAAAVSAAVASGIIVVFSSGNGHHGFPGQHPDVISAGGAYMFPNGAVQASDYASGFTSAVYPNRRCPDVSGLVGMKPKAAYIMLPVQDASTIDTSVAVAGTYPNSDETTTSDGWAAISGTSAAAPQIAGVCALMKQKRSTLTPAQAKSILMGTAIDVTTGVSNTSSGGFPAAVGFDLATGSGLVDSFRAVSAT